MKIKNITGGILQDTKMGWILQPGQVIEVDSSKPEVVQRVQQLKNHNLIAVVEGELPEAGVTVKPVEVEEDTPDTVETATETTAEVAAETAIEEPVTAENNEEPAEQPDEDESSTSKKRSRKK